MARFFMNGQQQNIAAAGRASKAISQTYQEINAMTRDSYEYQQRVQDRTNEKFSQAIRGVDEYKDSDGNRYELESGAKDAWVSRGTNEHLLSDNPNYNPNEDLGWTQNWEKLERAN